MRSDVMKLAQTYKSQGMTMSDAMKKAYEDIDRSQYQTSGTAKSESEKTKKYWTGAAFDISKGWDLLKTGFKTAVAGVAAVTGSLVAISAATEEYRIAQGKLNTAFEAAGYSSETAATAYNEFYKILGDTDTATEASQLLAKLAENEQDMETWTRAAAGVWGTFGDALPIESLIEAANETAKTGTVVGTLADALNWAGISEDEFNAKLAAAGDESERNRLIMETLSSTYDTAADSFYKNNEQIIKNREQQAKLTEAMASAGDAVDKVKGAFVERFMPAISGAADKVAEWLNGMDVNAVIDTAIEKITEIKDLFIQLLPAIVGVTTAVVTFRTIMTISAIIDTVTKAITAFKLANDAATLSQAALNAVMNLNPFVLIVTLIAGLVAALITLWSTNEDFRNAVTVIWEQIKVLFSSAWEWIVNTWNQFQPYFQAAWDFLVAVFSQVVETLGGFFSAAWEFIVGVWNAAQPYFAAIWNFIQSVFAVVAPILSGFFRTAWNLIKGVWDVVSGYFRNIWNTIKGIFAVVEAVLSGNFSDAWEAIKEVLAGWGEFFQGLWDKILEIFSGLWDTFKGFGDDIIEALKDGINAAWDGLVSWFNGLWDGLFGNKTANVTVNKTVNETVNSVPGGGSSASIGAGRRSVDGSHRLGLNYVPFDGYIAELHKGERVLTADQARKQDSGSGNITVVQNIYSQAKSAAELMREARNSQRKAVLMGSV